MRLAEALALRADRQKRLGQLRQRLAQNVLVQEGDDPAEDPRELMEEFERASDELRALIRNINRTNSSTTLESGESLTDALAARDVLGLKQAAYRELAQAASIQSNRYSRSEVKFVSTINVAETQRRADDLAREYRELDTRIQEANWSTDLIE